MDNLHETHQRLIAAEAALALDPDNQELRDQVRRLGSVLSCFAHLAYARREAARGRRIIGAYMRRN